MFRMLECRNGKMNKISNKSFSECQSVVPPGVLVCPSPQESGVCFVFFSFFFFVEGRGRLGGNHSLRLSDPPPSPLSGPNLIGGILGRGGDGEGGVGEAATFGPKTVTSQNLSKWPET